MSELQTLPFIWNPGQGPDASALERLIEAFPKPKRPMGEAWFLAPERKMYPQLLDNLETVSDDDILDALQDTAGTTCFGPHDEWTEWFHYLFPRLIEREWGLTLAHPIESIVTAFAAQYPEPEGATPYPLFRQDALQTVGQRIMAPDCWPGGLLHLHKCLNKSRSVNGAMGWYETEGPLSASLFFCLKYLRPEQISGWFRSVLNIPNPFWTAQIIVWLIGAYPLLTGNIEQPSQFPEEGPYRITWEWSHALNGNYSGSFEEPIERIPFIPAANRMALLAVIRPADFEDFLMEWQTHPDLEELRAETAGAPERFLELYGRSSTAA